MVRLGIHPDRFWRLYPREIQMLKRQYESLREEERLMKGKIWAAIVNQGSLAEVRPKAKAEDF